MLISIGVVVVVELAQNGLVYVLPYKRMPMCSSLTSA